MTPAEYLDTSLRAMPMFLAQWNITYDPLLLNIRNTTSDPTVYDTESEDDEE
jgi:hypothetical protein